MVGITSYGAYIPLRRLTQGTAGWWSPNEKAVAYYDEDSLTMAVAAAIDCLSETERNSVDGLYVASTTLPYREKLAATTVAAAADLRNDIFTVDCSGSLRAGTSALRMASDTVKAGSARKILVTASDCRIGPAYSELDQTLGDGAAAFLIGEENVVASIEASFSVSNELFDIWRGDTSTTIHTWEERWVEQEGYLKVFQQAFVDFFKKNSITAKDVTRAAIYGPNSKRHAQMARTLGFVQSQIQDPLLTSVGNTGTASSLMMLTAALENANPGDSILCASYGNGVDILLLRVTEEIKRIGPRRGIKQNLACKTDLPNYSNYFGFRHQSRDPEEGPGPSASVIAREREAIYPLRGCKCRVCGTVQYPTQRVCTNCHSKDSYDSIRLSDKRAKIFTRVLDYEAPVPGYDLPSVNVLIDWECGGRGDFALTDRKSEPEDVPMGMEVEMTFRKLRASGGIHNYYWKAMPIRESWLQKEE